GDRSIERSDDGQVLPIRRGIGELSFSLFDSRIRTGDLCLLLSTLSANSSGAGAANRRVRQICFGHFERASRCLDTSFCGGNRGSLLSLCRSGFLALAL